MCTLSEQILNIYFGSIQICIFLFSIILYGGGFCGLTFVRISTFYCIVQIRRMFGTKTDVLLFVSSKYSLNLFLVIFKKYLLFLFYSCFKIP